MDGGMNSVVSAALAQLSNSLQMSSASAAASSQVAPQPQSRLQQNYGQTLASRSMTVPTQHQPLLLALQSQAALAASFLPYTHHHAPAPSQSARTPSHQAITDLVSYYTTVQMGGTTCTCPYSQGPCPLHHATQTVFTTDPSPGATSFLQPMPTQSLSSLGPLTLAPQQPQTAYAPNPRPAPTSADNLRHLIFSHQQQRIVANTNAVAAAAAAAAAVSQQQHQPSAASTRLKRRAFNSSDARLPAKVPRGISMDQAAPSSSQQLLLGAPSTVDASAQLSLDAGASLTSMGLIGPPTCCTNCRQPFNGSLHTVSLCACHGRTDCENAGNICGLCFSMSSLPRPEPRLTDNLNMSVQHQVLQLRSQAHAERMQQVNNHFYRQHSYDLNSAAAVQNMSSSAAVAAALPQATAHHTSPLMILNPQALELLLLTTNDPRAVIFNGNLQSQHSSSVHQQMQTLQQVLSTTGHMSEIPPIGATPNEIKANTSIVTYSKEEDIPEELRERCTVCLVDFETEDELRALNCCHMFHVGCIDRWLTYNKKCPVCRVEIDKPGKIIADFAECT